MRLRGPAAAPSHCPSASARRNALAPRRAAVRSSQQFLPSSWPHWRLSALSGRAERKGRCASARGSAAGRADWHAGARERARASAGKSEHAPGEWELGRTNGGEEPQAEELQHEQSPFKAFECRSYINHDYDIMMCWIFKFKPILGKFGPGDVPASCPPLHIYNCAVACHGGGQIATFAAMPP